MDKLIRADALLCQIDSPYTEYPVIIQIRRAIREMIEDAPAVDAVPVVRCKECKFWHMVDDFDIKQYGECDEMIRESIFTNEDFYCCAGERKDDAVG